MLAHVSTVFQAVSLILVFCVLLLPEHRLDTAAVIVLVLGWIPVSWVLRPRAAMVLRGVGLIAVCGMTVASEGMYERGIEATGSESAAVVLALGWLVFLLCVPDGAQVSFPIALLSCGSSIYMLRPDESWREMAVSAAVLLLLASGGGFFIGSLVNPRVGSARITRLSAYRFLPHIVVLVGAVAVVLLLGDWVRSQVGRVDFTVLSGSAEDRTCALASEAPRFRNRTVCKVLALEGPMPAYLAERVFYQYLDGRWENGQSAGLPGNGYGYPRDAFAGRKPEGRCAVQSMRSDTPPPVPFGVVRDDASEGPSELRGGTVAAYSWEGRPVRGLRMMAPAGALTTPDLARLSRLVTRLCYSARDDRERMTRIVHHLQSQIIYDISSSFRTEEGVDPTEHLLFRSKRGWCVHLGTAAALMCREAGIPARFVVGYAVTPIGREVEVQDRAGHAWCEVLLDGPTGRTWEVVDPSALPAGTRNPVSVRRLHRVLAVVLLVVVVLLLPQLHGRLSVRDLRKRLEADAAATAPTRILSCYRRALEFLERLGIYRDRTMTAREFAAEVAAPHRDDFETITRAFERVKYMGHRDVVDEAREAEAAVRRMFLMTGRPRWSGGSLSD